MIGVSRARWRLAVGVASVLAVAGAYGGPVATQAATPTVVTIQFDDGNADAYQWISGLNNHGLHATFYVNSGTIGADSAHMTWAQLTNLAATGNEIASHTINHVDIKKLKLADARYQVCQDRVNIASHGLQPESFAYPYGDYNSAVETQVVQYCGDNSGRTVTGVDDKKAFAETIPPADPYATRTPPDPKRGTTVATIEGYVTAAETHGGGWVQLTFHHICNGCDAYSITASDMQSLLDWLSGQVSSGAVVVETTEQVIGGTYKTPFCC